MFVLVENHLIDLNETRSVSVLPGSTNGTGRPVQLQVWFKEASQPVTYDLTITYETALEQLSGYESGTHKATAAEKKAAAK